MSDIKINSETGQIDRTTREGKLLDELQAQATAQAGTPMGEFMNQVLAYMEAGMVISATLPPDEAETALGKLRANLQNM